MLSLRIRFLRRYHATPWGNHPNQEEAVEWPPSPWRLARAMISAYYVATPRPAESVVVSMLAKIAGSLPSYRLPAAYTGHTRHYYTPEVKQEIIDAFLSIRDPLHVVYPDVELDAAEYVALNDSILPNIRYLGRAESLCVADTADPPPDTNCVPLGADAGDAEIVDVLAPKPGCELLDISPLSLSARPDDLQRAKRIDPPAGRWVQYARRMPGRHSKAARRHRQANVARFALVGSPLPSILQAPVVGRAVRSAALSKLQEPSETLTGHRADGEPASGHNHAMFLPTAEADTTRIDHITVVARSGFGDAEMKALLGVMNIYAHKMPRVRAVFESVGTPGDFPGVDILGRSRVWRTVTPVVFGRHVKYRSGGRTVDGLESQIVSEIKERYGHGVRRVDLLGTVGRYRPVEFPWPRMHGRRGGQTMGVRIEFEREVSGPLALGYASHYGMGLFAPEGTYDG